MMEYPLVIKETFDARRLRINRRSLLVGAGASAGFMFLGTGPAAASRSERFSIRYVVIDRRHAASLEFGRVLADYGSVQLDVTDGLTRMWQETLAPHWREPGGKIAGITSPPVWCCIAEQARSQARKTVFKGRHEPDHTGAMVHVVTVPGEPTRTANEIARQQHRWPHALAELIGGCPPGTAVCSREWLSSNAFPDLAMPNSLTSWIIA